MSIELNAVRETKRIDTKKLRDFIVCPINSDIFATAKHFFVFTFGGLYNEKSFTFSCQFVQKLVNVLLLPEPVEPVMKT